MNANASHRPQPYSPREIPHISWEGDTASSRKRGEWSGQWQALLQAILSRSGLLTEEWIHGLRRYIMTPKFEDLMKELKEILARIEDNQTGLDEAIALYERGAVLVRQAEDILASAEMKITMLGRD